MAETEPGRLGVTVRGWRALAGGWAASLAISLLANYLSSLGFPQSTLGRVFSSLSNGRVVALFLSRPGWLALKFVTVLSATVCGMLVVGALWGPFSAFLRLSFRLKMMGSALIAVALSLWGIRLIAEGPYANTSREAAIVCPQCAQLGPCAVRVYANNGDVTYVLHPHRKTGDPPGYAEITLQADRSDEEHGAGWILFLPHGADLRSFKALHFMIRGKKGGERVGIKVKDARGTEVSVPAIGSYIGGITSRWQEVRIPLQAFPKVDFGLMDNLSFYVTGGLAGTEPQTIDVGDLEWTAE